MASKSSKKSKKPLETTLGKAKPQKNDDEVDISAVRQPIDTRVSGLRQAIALLDTATEEVKNYVMYECDIMYECRICRNIFRSLANFILHKRNYCRDRFSPLDYLNNNGNYQEVVYPLPDNLNQNNVCSDKPKEKEKKTLNPVIDKLLNKHKIEQFCNSVMSESLLKTGNPLDKPVKNMEDCEIKYGNNTILLEKIDSNQSAVFQTLVRHGSDDSVQSHSSTRSDVTNISNMTECSVKSTKFEKDKIQLVQDENKGVYLDNNVEKDVHKSSEDKTTNEHNDVSMKSQVMELHGILEDKIVVGPDGKLKGYYKEKASGNSLPKKYFTCTECNVRFTTKKTLTFHLRTRHNKTAKIYYCPTCKELLATPWCVFRHLIKVHRMSNKQVKNMREKVHNSWVIQEDASTIEAKKKAVESSGQDETTNDAENQWINNIEEDNDLQMCAGCGKRFERRAALHSHSVMCAKRIAVCATIKENKKKEEEESLEKAKLGHILGTLKGASKRKGQVIWRKTNSFVTNSADIKNEIDDTENKSTELPSKLIVLSKNSTSPTVHNIPSLFNNKLIVNSPTKEICIALPRQRVEELKERFERDQLTNLPKETCTEVKIENLNSEDNHHTNVPKNSCSISSSQDSLRKHQFNESLECSDKIESQITVSKKKRRLSRNSKGSIEDLISDHSDNLNRDEKNVLINERLIEGSKTNIFNDLKCKPFEDLVKSFDIKPASAHKCNDKKSIRRLRVGDKIKISSKNIAKYRATHIKESTTDLDEGIGIENTEEQAQKTSEIEHGFAGFPPEEIQDFRFGVGDLSTLSYNNPLRKLKFKKDSSKQKRLNIKKSKGKLPNIADMETMHFNKQRESTFIKKASPYMNQEQLYCIPCSLTFDSFSLLLYHMSCHFSWFRFQCSKCSFISYNKLDCMTHAKERHILTTESSIASVVLPVPIWKTILLSHEFRPLGHFDNLKGKHTDETVLLEESLPSSPVEEIETNETNSNDLFSDCDKKPNISSVLMPNVSSSSLKNSDNIDITEQTEDCQKLKEPEELVVMPPDISEVFSNLKYKEYVPFEERTPRNVELHDDSSNDAEFYEEFFKKIEAKKVSDKSTDMDDNTNKSNSPENGTPLEDVFYRKDSPTFSMRPSRIRTKAKLYEDFVYYDLNSAFKSSDPPKISNVKTTKISPIPTLVQKKKT